MKILTFDKKYFSINLDIAKKNIPLGSACFAFKTGISRSTEFDSSSTNVNASL